MRHHAATRPTTPSYNSGLKQSDMPVASPGFLRTASSVVDLIGNTPLIRLSGFEDGLRNVELYAKAEWKNPGGSVKDRAAARMIADGERSGALTRDKIILDATSGNTGIAYAMIGAARGYRGPAVRARERDPGAEADPQGVRRRGRLHRSDAGIRWRDHPRQTDVRREPGLYFYPDQYNNPGNWRAHYDTTAPELIEQTGGRLTHFVAGLGTSGTFVGVGPAASRVQPRHPVDLGAAGLTVARARRVEAHGDGDRAGHLRCDAG